MIEDDDASAGPADAAHLAGDADRIGHDADHVRRVDEIEAVIREFKIGRIHLQQADVAHAFPEHAVAGFFEHRARQIDAGHGAVGRIKRRIDPGADADFQHPLAGLDAHSPNRIDTPGVERGTEHEVVHGRELFVHPRDEIVLDRSARQRPRRGIRPEDLFGFLRTIRLK